MNLKPDSDYWRRFGEAIWLLGTVALYCVFAVAVVSFCMLQMPPFLGFVIAMLCIGVVAALIMARRGL